MKSVYDEGSIIDDKYIILEKLGKGEFASVYLTRNKNEDEKENKQYAVKVLKRIDDDINIKIKIINEINNLNNFYIIKYIKDGKGQVKKIKGNIVKSKIRQYIVYEFAKKKTLLKYLIYPNSNCLEEKYAKIIFKKILRGIEAMHMANICHRDIKLENILLDLTYNPKICDFGFSIICLKKLDDRCCTPSYGAPEIMRLKGFRPYDGLKADIFSLGMTLLRIVTGKQNRNTDEFIKHTKNYDYPSFLKLLNTQIKETSEKFQKLITKMLDFNPKERLSIDKVINDPWFNEVKENDNIQEFELLKEFKKREEKIIEKNNNKFKYISQRKKENKKGDRDLNEDLYEYFVQDDIKIKEIDDSYLILEDYIKIEGNLIPLDFMNLIANKIKTEYEDWEIIPSGESFKFDIEIKKEDEPNEELNQEEIQGKLDEYEEEEINEDFDFNVKTLIVQIILFKSGKNSYLVRFYKKSGDAEEYYENLNNIISIIKNYI